MDEKGTPDDMSTLPEAAGHQDGDTLELPAISWRHRRYPQSWGRIVGTLCVYLALPFLFTRMGSLIWVTGGASAVPLWGFGAFLLVLAIGLRMAVRIARRNGSEVFGRSRPGRLRRWLSWLVLPKLPVVAMGMSGAAWAVALILFTAFGPSHYVQLGSASGRDRCTVVAEVNHFLSYSGRIYVAHWSGIAHQIGSFSSQDDPFPGAGEDAITWLGHEGTIAAVADDRTRKPITLHC
jgi:hypothetical protein